MGWWRISADTLARSRFVISPLAEATASLLALHRRRAGYPAERTWLATHLPAYRDRLAADPVTALLLRCALGQAWIADFLTPTPTGDGEPDFAEELARLRATPPADARADLEVSHRGLLPAALVRDDLPDRAADLIEWVWTTAVLPDWPRRNRIIEADVISRAGTLSQGGWAAALAGLSPGVRWLGQSRLQINTHDYPPRTVSGEKLMFVPVTPRTGWVSWDASGRFAVTYQVSALLADSGAVPTPAALGRLLGPARANVLVLLDFPKSTTQLVAMTGQGLGSVGRHLKVLFDAGLVRRRRVGRSVLYYRTPAGTTLVRCGR